VKSLPRPESRRTLLLLLYYNVGGGGGAYHYHHCCNVFAVAAGRGVRSRRVFATTERAAAGAGNRRKTDFLGFRRVYSFQACRVFTTRRGVSSLGTAAA